MTKEKETTNAHSSLCKIGTRLKQLRKDQGLTQQQMAEKLDISVTHYSNIERGERNCSMEMFIRICQLFSLPGNNLLRDYLPMPNSASSPVPDKFTSLPLDFQNLVSDTVDQFILLMKKYEQKMKK